MDPADGWPEVRKAGDGRIDAASNAGGGIWRRRMEDGGGRGGEGGGVGRGGVGRGGGGGEGKGRKD